MSTGFQMLFCSPSPDSTRQTRPLSVGYVATGVAALLLSFAGIAAQGQRKLSLHEAIQQAQNSPAAHIAQSQVDAVQGQIKQASLRPNPRLYLQSEDLRPWSNNFDFANNTEDYGYVGQLIEMGGKRSNRLQLANANLRRTEADRSLQMQQLAGRVAANYWNAASTARISELLQQDLTAVDAMVSYHKERVESGAMRGVDLLRMQIERDRLLIALEAARREAALARVELAGQIGQPLGSDVELTDSIDVLETVPKQDISVVLAQRADVAAAREAVAAAEADLKLQKSLGVPDLDLLGGYKRNSGADTLYSALQIPLPIGNRNQGEVQRAQANIQIAHAQLQQVT